MMKWKNNKPDIGDFRYRTRFAWLPTTVLDFLTKEEYTVWLEWYEEKSEWKHTIFPEYGPGWVMISKLIYVRNN